MHWMPGAVFPVALSFVRVLQGKSNGTFEQCYYGAQKQYRVTKLSPASRYSFRLAAKNDMGVR